MDMSITRMATDRINALPMSENRRKGIAIVIVLGLLIAVGLYFRWVELTPGYYMGGAWVTLTVVSLWWGNRKITRWLNRLLPWQKYTYVRLPLHVLLSVAYSLLCLNLTYLLIKNLFTADPPTPYQLAYMNMYGLAVVLPATLVYFIVYFINAWRRSSLESERLQKETIRSQLETLRSHIDPHFLFNNLNILSALIDKDPRSAKQFLSKFSEVYRFLLQNKEAELVTLDEELTFMQAYLFLIETRFEDGVKVHLHISKTHRQLQLPPMSLQILLENCLKHNKISEEHPLTINIVSKQNDYLCVSNELRPRPDEVHGTRTGLSNVTSRYRYFTNRPVQIQREGNCFSVNIPLLRVEEE